MILRAVLTLSLLLSCPALAERLLVCGFELQSTRAGVETDPGDVLGAAFIDAVQGHGGDAVARAVAVAGRRSSFRHYFVSATPAMFARVYVKLEQPVNVPTMFLLVRRSSAVPAIAWLTIDALGDVRARIWATDYNTPLTRLTVGQWHRFDLFVDERPASGGHLVQLAMDGQTFLLAEGLSLSHIVDTIEVGLNVNAEMASSGVMLFDDIAVNGTQGTLESGFPQPAQVFLLRPNGPATAPVWTNGDGGAANSDNWRQVSELPPDDGVTMLESRTNVRVQELFTMTAPPAIAASTPASLLMVGLRYSGDGTTNRSIAVLQQVGAGLLEQSISVSAATTNWVTNRDDGYLNILYVTLFSPEGQPWNAATLDDLRVGIIDGDSQARPLRVTSLFAHAEFPLPLEPRPPVVGARPDGGFDAGPGDSGTPDAGTPDAGTSDAGGSDAGTSDAGSTSDAGQPDGGTSMGQTDGGTDPDAGSERDPYVLAVGCACGAAPDGALLLLALGALLSRRRRS